MKLSDKVKLVVYVPESHGDALRKALGDAEAGKMGNYSHCSFTVKGMGRFKPLTGASPAIGEVGQLEEVAEERIETILHKDQVIHVIEAIKAVHPYEEIPIDLFPIYEF